MAVKIDKNKCNGCGVCKEICPVNAIKVEKGFVIISNDCVECGACVGQCPKGAISI